jgi:hypothetical protein
MKVAQILHDLDYTSALTRIDPPLLIEVDPGTMRG